MYAILLKETTWVAHSFSKRTVRSSSKGAVNIIPIISTKACVQCHKFLYASLFILTCRVLHGTVHSTSEGTVRAACSPSMGTLWDVHSSSEGTKHSFSKGGGAGEVDNPSRELHILYMLLLPSPVYESHKLLDASIFVFFLLLLFFFTFLLAQHVHYYQ